MDSFQVQVSICIGKKRPLPIPGFPALPSYIFGSVGPEESEEDANRRLNELLKFNPGYSFCVQRVTGEKKEPEGNS